MAKIVVDGQEYQVRDGDNLLEACLGAGLDLPYFCWHPAMGSIGSCRQCAVVQYQNAEDTRGRIVMGCMTPVAEGARFSLKAASATEFREGIIESLMLNHPHDCPVCAEGGECHLQDMTVMVGHRDRRYRGLKSTHRNQYLGPLIHHEMNRCITCYRCVRFYRDYAGGTDLSAQACHDHIYFGRHQDGVLESEFSGNLVEVCPTGVFTDKTLLKDYTRKWDLQSAPSICTGCAVGCNTAPGERYGRLKRIHNRYNPEVNGYFLCDRGRFGGGYVNSSRRLNFAGLRAGDGTFAAIHRDRALELAADWMTGASKADRVAAIGSPRASLEANWLLKELVGSDNFFMGCSEREGGVNGAILDALGATTVPTPSIRDMEQADAVLILGEDVTHTAPRIALALRQAVRTKAFELAKEARFPDWQDGAIRNLAQDQRSPLIIVSPLDTRLDDVASQLVSLPPQDIAGFALAIAQCLNTGATEDSRAAAVAEQLRGAKRPLVLAGSSLLRKDIVAAARAVAEALQGAEFHEGERKPMLSYCLAEANSLGAAMLGGNSLASLLERAGNIDTLIVLENDLSRRLQEDQFHRLLQGAGKVIALDVMENATLDNCHLALPAASFAESEGTLVSSEGRAQRHYPVFAPREERLPSWQWLQRLARITGHDVLRHLVHFDQIVAACARSQPRFAPLAAVSPDHTYRSHHLKIPRQTQRYSGRTAMFANVSVHEPQQPVDMETPLAYSMEGLNRDQPAPLTPFVWAPGWNSNQSLHKYQRESGGPLRDGGGGVRLIEPAISPRPAISATAGDDAMELEPHKWQLVPVYRVHGSEELSAQTPEIAELAGRPFVVVGEIVAQHHGVGDGDGLIVSNDIASQSLEVRIAGRVAKNCAGFSAGYGATLQFSPGDHVTLTKDETWQRTAPRVIASDRSSGHG